MVLVRFVATMFVLVVTLSCSAPSTDDPSRIYVFGDSLSDNGNAFLLTSGLLDGADFEQFVDTDISQEEIESLAQTFAPLFDDYYNGRFSNGRIYVDLLADEYGVRIRQFLSPTDGRNFAIAGSRAAFIGQQIDLFLENKREDIDSNHLFIVWGGANDVRDIIQGNAEASQIDTAILALRTGIEALHAAGADRFLVPNIPNLGQVPEVTVLEDVSPGISATATTLSQSFNTALKTMIDDLVAQDINITTYDIYTLFENVASDPETYAITNATDACYEDSDTICSEPDSHLFWDGLHPSAAAHAIIADEFIKII